MEEQSNILSKYITIFVALLALFGIYLASLYNYLLFHSLGELFSIIVACGIFIVAWNARRFLDNTYLLFIGIAYLFIGGLDLIHTLGYKGMNIFQGYDTNLPTQLWIAARYVESLSLLVAPLFLGRRLKTNFVILGYTVVISLLLASIFYWNTFPQCFVEGVGLTPFKKVSEYVICLILLGSIFLLFHNSREFDGRVFKLLVASIIITIASELAFTFYIHAYGLSNMIGHFFKIISFYLIYKAIIETGLMRPYDLLFRNLQQSKEALAQQAQELACSNAELEKEITHRKQMQEKLLIAERLATLGKFSGSISHELRNPLGVIDSSAYYLKTKLKNCDGKVQEHLDRIKSSVGSATAIIESLLNLTRMKEPQLEKLNLIPTISDTITMSKVPATVKVIRNLPESDVVVNADREQLIMVFKNIIKNGIEAMDGKGTLMVTISDDTDGQAEISFTDDGPGISTENVGRVFQPLFSTKAKGIGFGLSIVKMVIEKHGGTVEAKSETGRGTNMIIKLPLCPDGDKEAQTECLKS